MISGDIIIRVRRLYENFTLHTKMAILSRKIILLAIFLHEQFIHHAQINLRTNIQFLSTR